MAEDKCIDALSRGWNDQLGLFGCHDGGGFQFFAFSKSGQIITYDDEHCVATNDRKVTTADCSNDKSQLWTYDAKVFVIMIMTNSNTNAH